MATLATNVSFQCLGLDGKPLAGGKVYTYEAGTTTPKSTYTTMAGTVANPNPVILDQNGKAKIFLGDGSYRMRILDSNDALIDDINQISRYVTQSEFASFQQAVNDGVSQLTEVREQIDVYVDTAISNKKGFAGGVAPLDQNVKIDPIYLPTLPNTAIPQATEIAFGVVKLINDLTSTDTTKALTAAQGKVLGDRDFGVGQTQQRFTSERLANTTYTNSTGKPIEVRIVVNGGVSSTGNTVQVGGVDIYEFDVHTNMSAPFCFTVQEGQTYRINVTSTIHSWSELR